jgi:hypothetical protein
MAMPSFTAAASLYPTSGHYQMAGIPGAAAGGTHVVPQFTVCSPCFGLPIIGGLKICCDISVFPPHVSCRIVRC